MFVNKVHLKTKHIWVFLDAWVDDAAFINHDQSARRRSNPLRCTSRSRLSSEINSWSRFVHFLTFVPQLRRVCLGKFQVLIRTVLIELILPPMGLQVYDTYGKSESEQTLIGGETGRESSGGGLVSISWLLLRLSLGAAIVYPRCSRPASLETGRC